MTSEEKVKVIEIAYKSRKGILNDEDASFCERMWRKYPVEYADAAVEGRRIADEEVNPF